MTTFRPPTGKTLVALAGFLGLTLLAVAVVWLGRIPISEMLVERAAEAYRIGDLEATDRYLGHALRLDPTSIDASLLKARRLQFRGDFAGSQALLVGLDASNLDEPQRLGHLTTRATNLLRMSRLDEAEALFGEALDLARGLGDRDSELAIRLHLGRMGFYFTHDYESAQRHLESARRLASDTGNEGRGAEASALLGQLLWWWKHEVDDPLPDYFEPALEVFQRRGDRYNEAETLHKIAYFHAYDGNLLEFFKFQDRSIALRETLDDRPGLAHEYLTLGWTYLRLHDTRRAQRFLEKSLEVNADGGDLFAFLRAQRLLADCEMRQGFLDEARGRLQRALDREPQPSGEPLVAPEDPFLWAQLGEVARQQRLPLESRRFFEKALALGRAGNLGASNQIWMLEGLSDSFIATGDYNRAAEIVAEMETLATGIRHGGSIRRLQLQRAALAEAHGERQAAFRALLEAEQIQLRSVATAPVASDTTSKTHERLLAMLLSAAVDPVLPPLVEGGSGAHARLAFELLEQRSYGFYRDLVVLSVGRKRRDAAEAEAALAGLRDLFQTSAGQRSELPADSISRLQAAYGRYEDLLLRQALSNDDYLAVRRTQPPGLVEVQQALAPDTALLQYVLAEGKAYCLVIRSDRLQVVALPIERRQLEPKARLFRSLALDPDRSTTVGRSDATTSHAEMSEDTRWQPVAGDLFKRLIEPLLKEGSDHLTGVRRLGIIPYGELHDIPFAALHDPARDRFLIDDFDLFLLPAASLIVTKTPSEPAAEGVLAMGIRDAGRSAPLAFAIEEAETAVALLGGRALLQNDATETSLKANGGDYRFLHLATHGVSEPQTPLLSHLLLQPTAEDDGRLTVGEIFQLDLRAELVVLAGCRTGLSSSPDGSRRGPVGRLGLIQATLHGGAQSVLASLAPLSDAATLAFMHSFYSELISSEPRGRPTPHSDRAAALAQVQRAMAAGQLDSAGTASSLRHPRHWAPFVLVGS